MSYLAPSASSSQSTARIRQRTVNNKSQWQSPHAISIHILDNDSLLNIFYFYRPITFDAHDDEDARLIGGKKWVRERWWYQLAHVCQRWRNLILGSPSYLGVCLICTFGTPVADMLAQSPPLPLIIDYFSKDDITAEDEEAIFLALEQRDRVRCIRLAMLVPSLQKVVKAIDEEYPILEYLIISPLGDSSTALVLPETLRAPHLRHLMLSSFALPIGSLLLTTAVGLVTLCLIIIKGHPDTYFQPNTLLQWLSAMPQLETLVIFILSTLPNRDVERQPIHVPNMTHVTLPNLRWFTFKGGSAYMEAVVRRVTAPRLKKLQLDFFRQLTFSIPCLIQFLSTIENFRFDSAKVHFLGERVYVELYSREEVEMSLVLNVYCWYLDRQVSSVAPIFNALNQIFSTVEHLTLEHEAHSRSSEEHNEVDRTEWHELLRSCSNVKTLSVEDGLVGQLSRSLRLDDEELPLDLLPALQELTYYVGSGDVGDAFTSFIDARRKAGLPVTLVRRSPS